MAWYRAYRHELKLPDRDHDFLKPFYGDIVRPLGRIPRLPLMRTLQAHYAAFQACVERPDNRATSIQELFRGLRAALGRLDYDRIRWSESFND